MLGELVKVVEIRAFVIVVYRNGSEDPEVFRVLPTHHLRDVEPICELRLSAARWGLADAVQACDLEATKTSFHERAKKLCTCQGKYFVARAVTYFFLQVHRQ